MKTPTCRTTEISIKVIKIKPAYMGPVSWIGHVERMEDSRMPKTVMREKIYTTRKRGRPQVR
jgi:hypothetical protein